MSALFTFSFIFTDESARVYVMHAHACMPAVQLSAEVWEQVFAFLVAKRLSLILKVIVEKGAWVRTHRVLVLLVCLLACFSLSRSAQCAFGCMCVCL